MTATVFATLSNDQADVAVVEVPKEERRVDAVIELQQCDLMYIGGGGTGVSFL